MCREKDKGVTDLTELFIDPYVDIEDVDRSGADGVDLYELFIDPYVDIEIVDRSGAYGVDLNVKNDRCCCFLFISSLLSLTITLVDRMTH